MTLIVYGSLGHRKAQKAEFLRLHFGLRHVAELSGRIESAVAYDPKNWPLLQHARALILVDQLPPRGAQAAHVLSAQEALDLAHRGVPYLT